MTIGEYRAKVQHDLREAASGKNYDECLDLAFLLELLEGAADDAPARFLTFSEIVQIGYVSANLAEELDKERRIPDGDRFRVVTRFFALAETCKLRGEEKTLATIADLVRTAFPARQASLSPTTAGSVVTVGEYRAQIKGDFERATAEKDRWQVEHLSSILELLEGVEDDAPAHFLTFSDIMRIGVAAQDQAKKFYQQGKITSGEHWRVVLYFFAIAEGYTLRGRPMPLDGIATAVRIQLEKQDQLENEELRRII